jgi:hypothetical protein
LPSTSLHPFALFLVFKDFLDCFKYQCVGSLYCVIGLRVIDGSEGYLHPDLMAEVLEHVSVKLFAIVNGDFSRDAVAVDDVLPKEFLDSYGD